MASMSVEVLKSLAWGIPQDLAKVLEYATIRRTVLVRRET
jgi:hypothetical protein